MKVSALCDNCYAERDSERYGHQVFGNDARRWFIQSVWKNLDKWDIQAREAGQKRRVFVMSMGDFFEQLPQCHPDAEEMDAVRKRAMVNMEKLDNLEFLVLTKRISNVKKMVWNQWLTYWPSNVRLGISVGTQKDADRDIPRLLNIGCKNFLSMEPLLEKVVIPDYTLQQLDWVITGGESGPKARVADPEWFRSLRDQCLTADVPFHFKQWGEWDENMVKVGRKKAGHLLDGKEWLQFP